MTVGDRMRKKRLELGFSQEEVSQKLGYKSRSSVNKMECSRNLPLTKVERVAEILGTTPAYLMGWEDSYSIESADLHLEMSEDKELQELYFYWKQLSNIGRKKVIDNASDLVQIYKKE